MYALPRACSHEKYRSINAFLKGEIGSLCCHSPLHPLLSLRAWFLPPRSLGMATAGSHLYTAKQSSLRWGGLSTIGLTRSTCELCLFCPNPYLIVAEGEVLYTLFRVPACLRSVRASACPLQHNHYTTFLRFCQGVFEKFFKKFFGRLRF